MASAILVGRSLVWCVLVLCVALGRHLWSFFYHEVFQTQFTAVILKRNGLASSQGWAFYKLGSPVECAIDYQYATGSELVQLFSYIF